MNRFIIILAALMLGACTTQVTEEDVENVQLQDGARYVGLDPFGNEDPSSVRKFKHHGGTNTNPAATKSGPFPDPWEKRKGPFPDPWQAEAQPAPDDDDKP